MSWPKFLLLAQAWNKEGPSNPPVASRRDGDGRGRARRLARARGDSPLCAVAQRVNGAREARLRALLLGRRRRRKRGGGEPRSGQAGKGNRGQSTVSATTLLNFSFLIELPFRVVKSGLERLEVKMKPHWLPLLRICYSFCSEVMTYYAMLLHPVKYHCPFCFSRSGKERDN